jgi:hypothetical protein
VINGGQLKEFAAIREIRVNTPLSVSISVYPWLSFFSQKSSRDGKHSPFIF